jgi:hypothetical protein
MGPSGHVLLWGCGLCGATGATFGISGGFRVLPVIQVRTTLGCLPLSISNTIVAALTDLKAPPGLPRGSVVGVLWRTSPDRVS